jgi:hypothetical protein
MMNALEDMTRRKILIISIFCCLMFFVTSCQGSELPEPITESEPVNLITSEELVGIWKSKNTTFHIRFKDDGTYQIAPSKTQINTVPYEHGTYELDGNKLTFTPADNSFECVGEIAIYSYVVLPSGEIRYDEIEDTCPKRAQIFTFPHERIE